MVLEHIGMPQPGDCRVVFSASAEELEAAIQAEQAAENPPQAEEDLLTAAVNRAIKAASDDGSLAQFIADANETAAGNTYEGLLGEDGAVPTEG